MNGFPLISIALGATVTLVTTPLTAWFLLAVAREYGSNRVPCLLYHQIHPENRRAGAEAIDPVYACFEDRFAEQMDYLKEAGYHTLTLDDLLRARRGETTLPHTAGIVTFDDGFASNYELGFPVSGATISARRSS
jgi:hypothetical protein